MGTSAALPVDRAVVIMRLLERRAMDLAARASRRTAGEKEAQLQSRRDDHSRKTAETQIILAMVMGAVSMAKRAKIDHAHCVCARNANQPHPLLYLAVERADNDEDSSLGSFAGCSLCQTSENSR